MKSSNRSIVVVLPAPFGPRKPNASLLDGEVEIPESYHVAVPLRETVRFDGGYGS
jgi:hypothetical protein